MGLDMGMAHFMVLVLVVERFGERSSEVTRERNGGTPTPVVLQKSAEAIEGNGVDGKTSRKNGVKK
jgi:hypothetical protein